MHSIDDRGLLPTESDLSDKYGSEFTDTLPLPTGKSVKTTANGAYSVSASMVELAENDEEVRKQLISMILNSGASTVRLEGNSKNSFKDNLNILNDILDDVNEHNLTESNEDRAEMALKNHIVREINALNQKPLNIYSAMHPIEMGEQQDAAKMSSLGSAEKTINSDDPSVKFMMQGQNMVGKEVIGITAVGLKGFFGLSTYYGMKLKEVVNAVSSMDDVAEIAAYLNKTLNVTGELMSPLANLDYTELIEVVASKPGSEELVGKLLTLQRNSNRTDAALAISGLLSAATDFCCRG